MKITVKSWIIFVILALLGVAIWCRLSLPEFSFVDLSVGKKLALEKAEQYLKERGINSSKYSKAIIFVTDYSADRYLQKALGFKGEEDFIKSNNYNFFSWAIRFYEENKKEEFDVYISSKTGEVVYFHHSIEDTESRETLDKEVAKKRVKEFLSKNFKFNFDEFDFHQEQVKKLDKRVDYGFSWEKKNVYIPWDKSKDSGGAKLLTGATISGEEIIAFSYLNLDIPEKFNRLVQHQMSMGQLLSSIATFLYLMWVGWAIVIMIRRQNAFVMHLSKKFFILVGLSILILNIISVFNDFQEVLYSYDTSNSFKAYIGYYLISIIVNFVFTSVVVVIPGIAGESLRADALPQKKYSSFLHYLTSTFYSRSISASICLGYLVFLMVLGLQSLMFYLGQRFLGVWVEHTRLTDLSAAYLPFLGAFIMGFKASMNEEIVFRIFGISWAKKYLKNSVLAAIVVSLIWGFGHSQYAIFPTWFRGIEVGAMGMVFAFIFLRYGIICLVVAHYLFDVFWGVASYLIGKSNTYLFSTSIFILALPLIFAIIAFIRNLPDKEKQVKSVLNKQQQYSLKVLVTYLSQSLKQGEKLEVIKTELILNGWDKVLVELAVKEVASEK